MDLHPGEQTLFHGHPSWRSTLLHYFGTLAIAVVAGVIVFFADKTATAILAFVVIMAIGIVVGYLRRIGTTYVVSNERLHIRRGLLSKHIQETRIDRVQNVNTNQSVFERLLQIGTVDFDTAGTDDSDFVFRGVAQPEKVVQQVDKATRAARTPAPGAAPAQSGL